MTDAIQHVVRTFFAAFTSGPDLPARLDALPALFLPQAMIIRTGAGAPIVDTVDSFIAPRRALLTDGTLTAFEEWPTSGTTTTAGDIAHHWCTYEKRGLREGTPFTGRGTKSLQFVRTADAGWRIASFTWHDEAAIS